ncbi:hypothetical protein [Thalassotalea marina]|uniref:Holin n=1 Tax=Thalassotalea marina TaxID=1673741 RepID=A0A919BKQ8_9GAMM|nr:hypothetical protein [Thalassotalea marina]GHF98061.1 hypothetical protein GCM10017161_28090 [Thalassotalea marina]
MTKMEFANKVESYVKKQKRDKWTHLACAIISFIVAFFPEIFNVFDLTLEHSDTSGFLMLGGLFIGRFLQLNSPSAEDELLIDAMDLLAIKKS